MCSNSTHVSTLQGANRRVGQFKPYPNVFGATFGFGDALLLQPADNGWVDISVDLFVSPGDDELFVQASLKILFMALAHDCRDCGEVEYRNQIFQINHFGMAKGKNSFGINVAIAPHFLSWAAEIHDREFPSVADEMAIFCNTLSGARNKRPFLKNEFSAGISGKNFVLTACSSASISSVGKIAYDKCGISLESEGSQSYMTQSTLLVGMAKFHMQAMLGIYNNQH